MGESKLEKTKEQRIKKELTRLKRLYKSIPKNKFDMVLPVLENAAFMQVTLEDLQENINRNGCCEEYQNGKNQHGTKATAELQAYNSLIKNYNTVTDRLDKLLPPEKQKSKMAMLRDG